jgi:serine/threonine protein kinase
MPQVGGFSRPSAFFNGREAPVDSGPACALFMRQVALKLVHPALGRGMSGRVAREREILAGLNHPNIAQLLDA